LNDAPAGRRRVPLAPSLEKKKARSILLRDTHVEEGKKSVVAA
jgi:hypothetical protein